MGRKNTQLRETRPGVSKLLVDGQSFLGVQQRGSMKKLEHHPVEAIRHLAYNGQPVCSLHLGLPSHILAVRCAQANGESVHWQVAAAPVARQATTKARLMYAKAKREAW